MVSKDSIWLASGTPWFDCHAARLSIAAPLSATAEHRMAGEAAAALLTRGQCNSQWQTNCIANCLGDSLAARRRGCRKQHDQRCKMQLSDLAAFSHSRRTISQQGRNPCSCHCAVNLPSFRSKKNLPKQGPFERPVADTLGLPAIAFA